LINIIRIAINRAEKEENNVNDAAPHNDEQKDIELNDINVEEGKSQDNVNVNTEAKTI
jgi:hypothetical protein